MKVTVLVLFFATFVAAEIVKRCHVPFMFNSNPTRSAGFINFSQFSSKCTVKMHAEIGWLPRGWYRFAVHEINQTRTNCDSLGPVVDLGYGSFFDLYFDCVGRNGYRTFTRFSCTPTLEPNRPASLIGRAIVMFQASPDEFPPTRFSKVLACGFVPSEIVEYQRISGDWNNYARRF